jgi:hypothetical protein
MVRRRRADFLTRGGPERRDFIIALTPAAFMICVEYHQVALLATLIPVGFSVNHSRLPASNQRACA